MSLRNININQGVVFNDIDVIEWMDAMTAIYEKCSVKAIDADKYRKRVEKYAEMMVNGKTDIDEIVNTLQHLEMNNITKGGKEHKDWTDFDRKNGLR